MKIESISMTNFGRHENITFDSAGTIAGIIGKNASGKSTVVLFLKWMLNDILPDVNQSYIRSIGTETKRGYKATGKVVLTTGGHRVTIYRELLASGGAKVELTVDDEPVIKSKKEAEARLQELFGTDKRAVDSLMVIHQGTLGDMVLGTPASRYEAFSRYLDITQLPTCEKRVDEGIKSLSERFVDYTVDKAEAVTRLEEAKRVLDERNAALSTMKDVSPELAKVADALNKLNVEAQLERSLASVTQSAETLEKDVKEFAAAHPESQASRLERQETLRKTIDNLTDNISKANELSLARSTLSVRESELAAASKSVEETLASIVPTLPELTIKIKEGTVQLGTSKLEKLPLIRATLAAYKSAEDKYNVAVSELEAAKAQTPANANDQIQVLRKEADTARFLHSVLKPMLGGSCSEGCPVCGGTSVPSKDKIEEQVRLKEEEIQSASAEISRLSQLVEAIAAKTTAVTFAEGTKRSAEDSLKNLPENYTEIVESEDKLIASVREAKVALESNAANVKRNAEANQRVENLRYKIAGLEQVIDQLKARLSGVVESATTAEELAKERDAAKEELTALRNIIGAYDRLEDRKKVRNSIGDARSQWENATTAADEALLAIGVARDDAVHDLSTLRLKLEVDQKQMLNTVAQIQADKRTVEVCEADIARINESMRQVEVGRAKVVKLRELKEALGRHGAPGDYLAAVYGLVLKRTQFYLSQMRSTFQVEVDEEDSLNFTFRDYNNMDGGTRPPSKLSGAQRVRMGLAFVLSLHDLVVPGLGLLILDEPSNHMDEASKEDLRDLLAQLEPILSARQSQLWVVDHSPVLQQAFTKTLLLV